MTSPRTCASPSGPDGGIDHGIPIHPGPSSGGILAPGTNSGAL